MKKIISILLAAVMVLAFAACGNNSGNNGGNTEYVEGNDRIIAEIKISDNDELICDTKINFAKKAIDAIEDVLERNGM